MHPFAKRNVPDRPLEWHAVNSPIASLEFTRWFSNQSDVYDIEFFGLVCDTNGAQVNLEVSSNGGGTYATASYLSNLSGWQMDTTTAAAPNVANGIMLINSFGTGLALANLGGSVTMYNPGESTLNKVFNGAVTAPISDGHWYSLKLAGIYNVATPVNAFRIRALTGKLTSGTVRVRGRARW